MIGWTLIWVSKPSRDSGIRFSGKHSAKWADIPQYGVWTTSHSVQHFREAPGPHGFVPSIIYQLYSHDFFQSSKLAPMAGPLILFLPTSIATFSVLGPVTGGEPNNWVQYLFMLPSFPYEVIVCELF